MSSPFSLLLVVKIRKRWEVVGFVAMNLSMMCLQMPRPSPLFASQDSAKAAPRIADEPVGTSHKDHGMLGISHSS